MGNTCINAGTYCAIFDSVATSLRATEAVILVMLGLLFL